MRYQIVKKAPDGVWRFIAHGARFDKAEAEATKARYIERGNACRLLPVSAHADSSK